MEDACRYMKVKVTPRCCSNGTETFSHQTCFSLPWHSQDGLERFPSPASLSPPQVGGCDPSSCIPKAHAWTGTNGACYTSGNAEARGGVEGWKQTRCCNGQTQPTAWEAPVSRPDPQLSPPIGSVTLWIPSGNPNIWEIPNRNPFSSAFLANPAAPPLHQHPHIPPCIPAAQQRRSCFPSPRNSHQ